MNIIVRTAGGRIVVRPDTGWNRKSEDYYVPGFVSEISYSPVLFARVSKPGKNVAPEFAARYYDAVGYGILLYADDLDDGSPEGFASSTCLDHTSLLPMPFYQREVLGHKDNYFRLSLDGREIYSTSCGTVSMIEEAIVEATKLLLVRYGDLVAIELEPHTGLCTRPCGQALVEAKYCGNNLMEFKIIF